LLGVALVAQLVTYMSTCLASLWREPCSRQKILRNTLRRLSQYDFFILSYEKQSV